MGLQGNGGNDPHYDETEEEVGRRRHLDLEELISSHKYLGKIMKA